LISQYFISPGESTLSPGESPLGPGESTFSSGESTLRSGETSSGEGTIGRNDLLPHVKTIHSLHNMFNPKKGRFQHRARQTNCCKIIVMNDA
jgi:hypothetical protein